MQKHNRPKVSPCPDVMLNWFGEFSIIEEWLHFLWKNLDFLSKDLHCLYKNSSTHQVRVLITRRSVAICIKVDDFCIKIDDFCIEIDDFCIKIDDLCIKMMSCVLTMMTCVLKMMDCVLNMMNYVLNMMNYVLKMMT